MYVFTRSGESWTQQAKLMTPDPVVWQSLGWSVAVSGDTAIAGARGDNAGGSYSGAAYVFTRSGAVWTQQAKLRASDPMANDEFGYAVALSGDTALVGAHYDDDWESNAGSVYVFKRSGASWAQQLEFTPDDAGVNDEFGAAVALSGDTALVGAFQHDGPETGSGAAYAAVLTQVPVDIISVIQALILLFVAADEIVRWIYRIRAPKETIVLTRGWGG
jgi:hypothetical protein